MKRKLFLWSDCLQEAPRSYVSDFNHGPANVYSILVKMSLQTNGQTIMHFIRQKFITNEDKVRKNDKISNYLYVILYTVAKWKFE